MHWVKALILLLVFPTLLFGQTEIVILNGIPLVQCSSSIEDSRHFPLTESQQLESRVLITKKGNKYFWATRGNRELTKTQSGAVTIFMEKGGAGYIRVVKTGDKTLYMEHLGLMLEIITYWGTANDFNP